MLFSAFTAPDLRPLHTDVPLSGVTISEDINASWSLDCTLDAARAYEEIYLSGAGEPVRGGNRVVNGGFESVDGGGTVIGWSGQFSHTTDGARSGSYAASLNARDADGTHEHLWSSWFPASSGRTFRVQPWVWKAAHGDLADTATFDVMLRVRMSNGDTRDFWGEPRGKSFGVGGYEQLTEDIYVPADLKVTEARILIRAQAGSGSYRVDDVLVSEVVDPGETVPLIRERGTVLVASDGAQRWAFLVDQAVPDAEDQERLRIQGVGHGMLPSSVPWLSEAESLVEVDALDIVRMVWGEVTDRGDSLPVSVDDTRSGVLLGEEERDVEFETGTGEQVSFEAGPFRLNWWSTDDLKATLDDLAEETPFEWRERVDFDPSSEAPPSFHIELGHPRLTVREKEHLRFELGLNVSDPQPPEDAEAFTEVLVIGNGEGSEKVRARAHRDVSWQRTVKVISDQSITSTRQARKVAQDAVDEADREGRWIETCTVVEHPAAPLASFGLGDVITVQGQTVWGHQRQTCRITGIERAVDDARVTLTLSRWRN